MIESILDLLFVTGFGVVVCLVTLRLPAFWSGGEAIPVHILELAAPRPIARGLVRAMPVAIATGWTMLAVLMVTRLVPESEEWGRKAARVLSFAGVAGMLVVASIILANRPRALVPPGLRDQAGAVAEWLKLRGPGRGSSDHD